MTPLIRKEIRLLLPFFGIALFLAAVPSWIIPEESYIAPINPVVYWAFGFGMMLLGLAPFGQELSLGTFSSLLAQPLQRNRVWLTKLLLISAAGLLALLVFVLSIHLRLDSILRAVTERILEIPADQFGSYNRSWNLNLQHSLLLSLHSFDFWRIGLTLVLVGLAGGLWTTLLFRQTGAALWFTILVPGVIFVSIGWFMPENNYSAYKIVSATLLGIYSVAGFVWARRMFMVAQDAQWLGGTISLAGLSSTKAQVESTQARRRKPVRALLRKEFQSQQINLLIAFGLLVLHLCTLASRGLFVQPKSSQLRFVLEAIPFLWLLLPWLLGSVTVAEERKLGTLESQLCLPASRRLQFAIKFCVPMILGLVLGAVVPWLVERLALVFHISGAVMSVNGTAPPPGLALLILCEIAATIAFLSFFASTLTRNTLQALGASIVVLGVCLAFFGWVTAFSFGEWGFSPWRGSLILFLGVPMFVLAILWRSFVQFNLLSVTWRAVLRSLGFIFLTLLIAAAATTFFYQRTWEFTMSLEPRHAASALQGSVQPKIRFTRNKVFALLPDGRLWAGASYTNLWLGDLYASPSAEEKAPSKIFVPLPQAGRFVGESNWTDIAGNALGMVAIKSDGSLWNIFEWSPNGTYRPDSESQQPVRIGTSSDWRSIAASGYSGYFLGLKKDGTIWGWSRTKSGELGTDARAVANEPVRMEIGSDWAEIFGTRNSYFGIKRDGTVWKWGDDWSTNANGLFSKSISLTSPRQCPFLGTNWISIQKLGDLQDLALAGDGLMQLEGELIPNVLGALGHRYDRRSHVFRLSDQDKTTFSDVRGDFDLVVGLTATGRILENWIYSSKNPWGETVWQPSKYNDWIAVDANHDSKMFVGLAADGTLSFWRDPYSQVVAGLYSHPPLVLGPTRRPVWNLNILASAK
jgi:hypothetical protein